MKAFPLFCVVSLLCLGFQNQARGTQQVRIQLKWHYQALGIEAVLLPGGPRLNQTHALLDDKAGFSISSPEDLLMHRSQGEPVTAIAGI